MAFVSYIEFNVSNTKKSAEFYKQVFGWNADRFSKENDYWIVAHGEGRGIDAGIQKAEGPTGTVAVVTVPNLDEVWAKAIPNLRSRREGVLSCVKTNSTKLSPTVRHRGHETINK